MTAKDMKKAFGLTLTALLFVVAFCSVLGAGAAAKFEDRLPEPPEGKVFKLVWHDEFDGTEIDETKWNIEEGPRRDGYWSGKALKLNGKGYLLIYAMKDGEKFLSGAVRSTGKFEHTYGYYVARIRLQRQPGHWSAFWLNGSGTEKVGDEGRDGTEIDIYEKFDSTTGMVQHNLHWDGYGEHHKHAGTGTYVHDLMKGFHTYSLWWKLDEYIFYIDGKETWRTDAGGVCQAPNHVILSNEIGKQAGDITRVELPDYFVVDYVRVYDLVDKSEE